MIIIPLDSIVSGPIFDLQIPLDGTTYTLALTWNVRAGGWFMDVMDEQSQTVYAASLRLCVGAAIGFVITGRPFPGFFVVYDTTKQGLDPGLNDLGHRCLLYYFEQADRTAIGV